MKNIFIITLLLVVVGVIGFFIFRSKYQQPQTTNTSQTVTPNTIQISNFAFVPDTLTVTSGTTVTWINNDSTSHIIKSSSFNSSELKQGDKYTFTFSNPGTYNYSCGIHPTMTGTIIVK